MIFIAVAFVWGAAAGLLGLEYAIARGWTIYEVREPPVREGTPGFRRQEAHDD